MTLSRRKFITGASAGLIIAAPAIVAIGSIMPVRSYTRWIHQGDGAFEWFRWNMKYEVWLSQSSNLAVDHPPTGVVSWSGKPTGDLRDGDYMLLSPGWRDND